MIPLLTYVVVAVIAGTIIERIQYRGLSPYNKENSREFSIVPAVIIGGFWPILLPAYGVFLGTKKFLDKFMKV